MNFSLQHYEFYLVCVRFICIRACGLEWILMKLCQFLWILYFGNRLLNGYKNCTKQRHLLYISRICVCEEIELLWTLGKSSEYGRLNYIINSFSTDFWRKKIMAGLNSDKFITIFRGKKRANRWEWMQMLANKHKYANTSLPRWSSC